MIRLLAVLALALTGCLPGCEPPVETAYAFRAPTGPNRFVAGDMASGGGGGAPTVRGTDNGTVAAAPSYLTSRTFTLASATTAGDFGTVCWWPADASPAASDGPGNTWTVCSPGGGTNIACATAPMTNSISSITLVGNQWNDWRVAFIALTGPTAREAGAAGCNAGQTYYANGLTTGTVTPAHANGAIINAVLSGWTGDPGTTTLTSAAPWATSLSAFSTVNSFYFATHLSPTNGVGYSSTWTHDNSASWEHVSIAAY